MWHLFRGLGVCSCFYERFTPSPVVPTCVVCAPALFACLPLCLLACFGLLACGPSRKALSSLAPLSGGGPRTVGDPGDAVVSVSTDHPGDGRVCVPGKVNLLRRLAERRSPRAVFFRKSSGHFSSAGGDNDDPAAHARRQPACAHAHHLPGEPRASCHQRPLLLFLRSLPRPLPAGSSSSSSSSGGGCICCSFVVSCNSRAFRLRRFFLSLFSPVPLRALAGLSR